MFDSGISASSLIAGLKNEIDVAIPISNRSYVDSLNSLEQLLYTEIIKEQKEAFLDTASDLSTSRLIFLSEISVPNSQKSVVSEDVYAVYIYDAEVIYPTKFTQLKKSTPATSPLIKYTWFEADYNKIGATVSEHSFRVIYFVRPALKMVNENDVVGAGNVMLPVEFIDLAKAKLRGDAYKIANEDALAAKWLNDYNVLLETFKEWVEKRRPHFGI